MLAGLETVDWAHLSHAYGPATDVPDLLRALVEPDRAPPQLRAAAAKAERSVRDQVIWTLWGNVFHQGTVTGSVVADRYHSRVLVTPSEVRRAMDYIRNNARKHAAQWGDHYAASYVDPFSSDGSRVTLPSATTWLVREGWRRAAAP